MTTGFTVFLTDPPHGLHARTLKFLIFNSIGATPDIVLRGQPHAYHIIDLILTQPRLFKSNQIFHVVLNT